MYKPKPLKIKPNFTIFIMILFLLFVNMFYYFALINRNTSPSEDAAMLMRYAKNLAEGYGFVYNQGGEPVDGATDFLFVVAIATVSKLGFSIELSTRAITLFSHLATVFLIFFSIVYILKLSKYLALLSALFFSLGPGIKYIEAYFGAGFFVLFVTISWIFAILCTKKQSSAYAFFFAFFALLSSLARPEGVFLSCFMLLSVIIKKGFINSRREITFFIILFFVLGGVYLLWRLFTFGHILPNPFYIKAKGKNFLQIPNIATPLYWVMIFSIPFIPVYILYILNKGIDRKMAFSFLPVALFTLIYFSISNLMNYLGRYQYAVMPFILMGWPELVPKIKRGTIRNISLFIFAMIIIIFYQTVTYLPEVKGEDGKYLVAKQLARFKGYTMLVSEAGLLPYYSEWKAIDSWGLNDGYIAQNGLSLEYIKQTDPHIIMFNSAKFGDIDPNNQWEKMVKLMEEYAKMNNYTLAAAFGESIHSVNFYYVKPGFEHSEEIINIIRNTNYTSWRGNRMRDLRCLI